VLLLEEVDGVSGSGKELQPVDCAIMVLVNCVEDGFDLHICTIRHRHPKCTSIISLLLQDTQHTSSSLRTCS
jgi:hypothetical protein